MNLLNYYWYFQSAIPYKICDDILEYGNGLEKQMALTGLIGNTDRTEPPSEEEIKDIQKKRKSDIVWLSDQWIYNEIHPYIHQANANAGWNFQWDWSDSCQFTEYKKGQFYDWHCDSSELPYKNPKEVNSYGKIRKLSMTVSLTDPEEYEGGDMEFDFRCTDEGSQPQICKELRSKGSVIVFPSFVWHRVKPVTRGIRNSLVCWNLGQPYV